MKYRIEQDVLGKKKVSANAFYGIFTQRALENFQISGEKMPEELIRALVLIKIAAAQANSQLGLLNKRKAKAIERAGKKVLREIKEEDFPLDVFQAGAGTPSHMNTNEVLTNYALKEIGKAKGSYQFIAPHDDLNLGQSSNNVVPSAVKVASVMLLDELIEALSGLAKGFKKKAKEFAKVKKSGRTHLMDAVPVSLGQEFEAYAVALEKRLKAAKEASGKLFELSVGGTAIGTGFNAHPRFAKLVAGNLKKLTGKGFRVSGNLIECTQSETDFLEFSNSLSELAVDLSRISNDLRLLGSGPRTGFNEIVLPEVEPGSSIMPGKINPSVPEMVNMVCVQVQGNSRTIELAAMSGQLELNFMAPVVGLNLVQSIKILTNAMKVLEKKCVRGIKANKAKCREYLEKSLGLGTALNKVIGYEKAAEVVKEAVKKNKPITEIILEKKLLSKKELKKVLEKS